MPPKASVTEKTTEMEDRLSSLSMKMEALEKDMQEYRMEAAQHTHEAKLQMMISNAIHSSESKFQIAIANVENRINKRLDSLEDLLKKLAVRNSIALDERKPIKIDEMPETTEVANFNIESADNVPQDFGCSQVDTNRDRDNLIRKIEMPVFEGSDASGWIAKVERFLKIGKYTDAEKLRIVSMSLDGKVLTWYNRYENRKPFVNWQELKTELLCMFGSSTEGAPNQHLFALKQKGTVQEFVSEFQYLSSQIHTLDDEDLEAIFLNGLKPEVQDLVLLLKPEGLTSIMGAAVRVESRVRVVENSLQQASRGFKNSGSHRSFSGQTLQTPWRIRSIQTDRPAQTNQLTSATGMGDTPCQ